jgi:hypothetical protein
MGTSGCGLVIGVKASGVILNPWYALPPDVMMGLSFVDDAVSSLKGSPRITESCRLDLPSHGITLLFQNDEVIFLFTGDATAAQYLVNPICHFLVYHTFINYNLFGPSRLETDGIEFEAMDPVRFRVQRLVRVETAVQEGHEELTRIHYTGEEHVLELPWRLLDQFLQVLNPTVYYAIASYLVGCENRRYFLIEFYKAVEFIEDALGGEKGLLSTLVPYGISRSKVKDFKKMCNDQRIAPVDIARHAPVHDAAVYRVDLRYIFEAPRSREIFESATAVCRNVIDAYIAWLATRPA